MAFNLLLDACANQKYCNFANLPLGEHLVFEFSIVETQYGERIRADLGDKYVYLPERFTKKLNQENIAELNETQNVLCYYGRDPLKNNKVLLDFKKVDDLDLSQYLLLNDRMTQQ